MNIDADIELVEAQELRQNAPTEQDMYNMKINGFQQNLMSSMVAKNSNRVFQYVSTVVEKGFGTVEITEQILNETKQTFESKGYIVTLEKIEATDKNPTHTVVTINWSPSETVN